MIVECLSALFSNLMKHEVTGITSSPIVVFIHSLRYLLCLFSVSSPSPPLPLSVYLSISLLLHNFMDYDEHQPCLPFTILFILPWRAFLLSSNSLLMTRQFTLSYPSCFFFFVSSSLLLFFLLFLFGVLFLVVRWGSLSLFVSVLYAYLFLLSFWVWLCWEQYPFVTMAAPGERRESCNFDIFVNFFCFWG